MTPATLTPLQRRVLAAANTSAGLSRVRGGYAAPATGDATPEVFNVRTLRMLERAGVLAFDDPALPRTATLTRTGRELAAAVTRESRRRAAAADLQRAAARHGFTAVTGKAGAA